MRFTIDRFEGDFAVVITDKGERFDLPKALLENGKEGDVFQITRNDNETEKQKEKIEKLMDDLWE